MNERGGKWRGLNVGEEMGIKGRLWRARGMSYVEVREGFLGA